MPHIVSYSPAEGHRVLQKGNSTILKHVPCGDTDANENDIIAYNLSSIRVKLELPNDAREKSMLRKQHDGTPNA